MRLSGGDPGRPRQSRTRILPGTRVWAGILENYGKAPTTQIAAHYGVSVSAVYKAAERMGIKLQVHWAWTEEEERFLIENHTMQTPQLRKAILGLSGTDRSERGIAWKRKDLRKRGRIPAYKAPEVLAVVEPTPAVDEFWRR